MKLQNLTKKRRSSIVKGLGQSQYSFLFSTPPLRKGTVLHAKRRFLNMAFLLNEQINITSNFT